MGQNKDLESISQIPDSKQWWPMVGAFKAEKDRKNNKPLVFTQDPFVGCIWFYYQAAWYLAVGASLGYGYAKYIHPHLPKIIEKIF